MTTPTIADLKATWTRPRFFKYPVTKAAIALLAEGRPATPHAVSAATGASLDQVAAAIAHARSMGVEVEAGAIVGAALTLRPTNHRFRIRGHDLYTDHALLSDCHSAALIDRAGSVEWWCAPRFDSPPLLGRLLDDRARQFSTGPTGDDHPRQRGCRRPTGPLRRAQPAAHVRA